jgi:excisionase family DNA binding protein
MLELTDTVYSVGEVSSMFKVTRKAVYDWMSEGKLAYFYVGGQRRIPREAIYAFLEASWEAAQQAAQRENGKKEEEEENSSPLRLAA